MVLQGVSLSYGADPEIFLVRDGEIIGSEKVIPEDGVGSEGLKVVIRDGVQVELNPSAVFGAGVFHLSMRKAFTALKSVLANHPSVTVSYDGLVEVSRKELDSLSPRSKVLGCQPSRNLYNNRPITVDVEKYRKRSAGGHVHVGLNGNMIKRDPTRLIPLLDIFVGNTCVMLDRDPGASERRQNYGRAGEYRLPSYGVEYRVLSNFWIRNNVLATLVLGLTHLSASILHMSMTGNDIEQEVIDVVSIGNVVKAIDTNDYELARANFNGVKPFLLKYLPETGNMFQVTSKNIEKLLVLADDVNLHGLGKYFDEDPIEHWTRAGVRPDFSQFIEGI